MTIEIIEAVLETDDEGGTIWSAWLEVEQAGEAYLLPTTAPGGLAEGGLQAYFDADEAALFSLAQAKGYAPDTIYERMERRVLKAFALVVLDEINLLRAQHGLAARTAEQLRSAIKARL